MHFEVSNLVCPVIVLVAYFDVLDFHWDVDAKCYKELAR